MTPLFFDHPHADHDAAVRTVGGKGASLWAIASLGLPVPPGFTIPIADARRLAADGFAAASRDALHAALARLEAEARRRLGDPADPLLLSVRSGAARSMPGMMDTLLNLGRGQDRAAALTTLEEAVLAVARSWDTPRARSYREHEGLAHDGDGSGSAVTVQAMVMGDRDADSASGVAFSRCPLTGAPGLTGELLWQAQGEAVVAGTHATAPLTSLGERLPAAHAALDAAACALELRYRDLVDVEFTIESGRLFLLQARPGKRSRAAAARVAVELAEHPAIRLTRAEALARTRDQLAGAPPRTRAAGAAPIAQGLPASPGLATGRLALTPDDAMAMADDGPVILARAETSPEDVHGMGVSAGLLTTLGGPLSHAALVAREWGIPAVVGASALKLDARGFSVLGRRVSAGDVLSIDGSTGEVFAGAVAGEIVEDPHAATLRRWAEEEA